jgi:hypothetical protein
MKQSEPRQQAIGQCATAGRGGAWMERCSLDVCPRRALTLADYERAARVALRDADAIRARLRRQLHELYELDARGHALRRDASDLTASEMLLSIGAALRAEQAQA